MFGTSQPSSTGSGNPPPLHPDTLAVRALENAVGILKDQREQLDKAAEIARKDLQDARDRVIRLEVKVDALPSKVWIGTAIASAVAFLTAIFGLLAILLRVLPHPG